MTTCIFPKGEEEDPARETEKKLEEKEKIHWLLQEIGMYIGQEDLLLKE